MIQPEPDKNTAKRKAIPKRVRFEVLRRDDHACRYCGVRVPDVVLTVDHVIPVALGGTDDPSNLVAACRDCNAGKASTGPGEHLVAQVNEDAIRWSRALQRAADMADAQYERDEASYASFEAHWNSYTFRNWKGEPISRPLPPDWRSTLANLVRQPGVTNGDFTDAIRIAMNAQKVDDEFSYFVGVMRNKIAQRQAIARQMIDSGLA